MNFFDIKTKGIYSFFTDKRYHNLYHQNVYDDAFEKPVGELQGNFEFMVLDIKEIVHNSSDATFVYAKILGISKEILGWALIGKILPDQYTVNHADYWTEITINHDK